MTVPLLTGPDSADSEPTRQENAQQEQPRSSSTTEPHADEAQSATAPPRHHIASEEECLAALTKLPVLITLGLLTTSQANAIRTTYQSVLAHHRHKQSTAQQQVAVNDDMLSILTQHPELANQFAPLLSDEQIKLLMARAKESGDGTA
jgi:hypothetical protein